MNELQAYEAAMLAFLREAHAIAAQLEHEGHPLAARLKAELHKAVSAHGAWRVAKWLGRGL
jgi:hypothetical protein